MQNKCLNKYYLVEAKYKLSCHLVFAQTDKKTFTYLLIEANILYYSKIFLDIC